MLEFALTAMVAATALFVMVAAAGVTVFLLLTLRDLWREHKGDSAYEH